jgi:hypothetical protein
MANLYVLTGNNSNEDTYFKDFMDKLEDEPEVAEELGIIRFTYVQDSSKCNIPKPRLQGINPVKLSGLHRKKRKTTIYLGKIGPRRLFII